LTQIGFPAGLVGCVLFAPVELTFRLIGIPDVVGESVVGASDCTDSSSVVIGTLVLGTVEASFDEFLGGIRLGGILDLVPMFSRV